MMLSLASIKSASAQEINLQQVSITASTTTITHAPDARLGNMFTQTADYSATSSAKILKNINNLLAVKISTDTKTKDTVSTIHDNSAQIIDVRITTLNTLSQRIDGAQQMSDTEKSSLQQEIAGQVSALKDLKNKISADVSAQSLKQDIKSLISTMRLYSITIPKAAFFIASDSINSAADDMQMFGTKLKTITDSASAQNKDTSQIQKILSDYNANVTGAQSMVSLAKNNLSRLPIGGNQIIYNSDMSILKDVQTEIKQAQQYLNLAQQDITKIRSAIAQPPTQTITAQSATTTSTTAKIQ